MSRCVIERDPDFVTSWMVLGAAGVEKGMHREAVAALQRAYTMSEGNSSIIVGQLAYGFARTGNRSEALKLVSEMSEKRSKCYASAQHIAGVHLALGDKGAAYEWLERACQERDHWLAYARHLPHLECIRSEPRFQELLRRVGPA
jgi:lipopolysaccharide biosynthesis regulator YciM